MTIKKKINTFKQALWQYRYNGFFTAHEALRLWVQNRNVSYSWVKPEYWCDYKTSDTIFVFGSGPSINEITEEQWEIIKSHDSIGLNFAFLTSFPMTFYYLGYENDPSAKRNINVAFTREIREVYKESLWFIPTRILHRLVHPRTFPAFFPPKPKLALFEIPEGIRLESDRDFQPEDFQQGLTYRGVMGIGLHLADYFGYRNIVLLGVDLHTFHHFFDDFELMKEEKREYEGKMGHLKVFESMVPKGNKYRTMEEYYYAINELYFRPKGVRLYVGNKNNILSPRIPLFPDFRKL